MPKQYTFKTTKSTQWMEEVLDAVPLQERSEFIRELLFSGMKIIGIPVGALTKSVVLTATLTSDSSQSEVLQKKVTQKTEEVSFIPDIQIIEENTEDLEDKLNRIGGI